MKQTKKIRLLSLLLCLVILPEMFPPTAAFAPETDTDSPAIDNVT